MTDKINENTNENIDEKPNTFWKLLGKYTIEIPIIQRDYAQGRQDAKTTQIRKAFVSDLFEMVANENKTIDLDFIYGSVKGPDKDKKLILLDGQQRLTTLFLLHCYLAAQADVLGNNDSNSEPQKTNRERLEKFTYKTRFSSRDFCKALVGNLKQIVSDIKKEEEKLTDATRKDNELSDAIKDASWFFYGWESDPTIKSMLVMLDEIHQVFKDKEENGQSLWGKLINESNPPITFQFLEMGVFDLTDELYIKMNARGKALTDFENFKAWLQGYVAENKKTMVVPDEFRNNIDEFWTNIDEFWTNFWTKIDKDWTDLFWSHRNKFKLKDTDKDTHRIDEPYMQFFRGMMLNHYASKAADTSADSDKEKAFIPLLHGKDYLPTSRIEKEECIDGNMLKEVKIVLDCLHNESYLASINTSLKKINFFYENNKEDQNDKNATRIFTTFCQNPTYPDRVLFYALACFIVKHNGEIDNDDKTIQLRKWMRVMRNLIRNTPVSADNFARAIRSIGKLKESCGDIYGYLSSLEISSTNSDDNGKISFFNQDQVDEEICKAKLINSDPKWEDELLKAENHEYFYGQIGFLIDFAKADDGSDASDLDKFKDYAAKASVLFNRKKEGNKDGLIDHSEFLLQRALLCFGNYLIQIKSKWSFCQSELSKRNDNWRLVFKDENKNIYLKQLLDKLDVGKEEAGLEAVILDGPDETTCTPRNDELADLLEKDWTWRQLLIQCPQAIEECKQRLIHFWGGNGCRHARFYLLGGIQMNGSHAELHSFEFYTNHVNDSKKAFMPFINKEYRRVNNSYTQPCAVLDKWDFDGKEIALDISYQDNYFQVELFARGNYRSDLPNDLFVWDDFQEKLSVDLKAKLQTSNDDASSEKTAITYHDKDSTENRGIFIEYIDSENIKDFLDSLCAYLSKIALK